MHTKRLIDANIIFCLSGNLRACYILCELVGAETKNLGSEETS